MNAALAKHPNVAETPLEVLLSDLSKVPEDIRAAVRNHGGGHYNHSLFWNMMRPQAPSFAEATAGKSGLADAINKTFGSFEKFKEAFTNAAVGHFGSGWVWLVKDREGKLLIVSTPNQDTPLSQNQAPLLGLDLWEHAYYLKYQNKRVDYIAAWWNIVNWNEVGTRLAL